MINAFFNIKFPILAKKKKKGLIVWRPSDFISGQPEGPRDLALISVRPQQARGFFELCFEAKNNCIISVGFTAKVLACSAKRSPCRGSHK